MRRNRKKGITYIFILLILGIGIGYAYLNSTLTINGTTNISSASWNVYWNNIQFGNNNVTTVTTPATISTGKTEVSFNVNFSEPGDTYEFTVDAVNDGTIDGMIDTFSNGVYAANGTTPKTIPDYLEYTVAYSDGVAIAQNQLLEAGNTETYKVRVHYKEDITASQLPSTADNFMFKFSVTYVQADSNAQAVDHPLNGIFYTANKGNFVSLNQEFPKTITRYSTANEALSAIASLSSRSLPFYLKHKIENNIVTESYVEFVVTPEMAEANSGLMTGTYTLRGEKIYDQETATSLVDEDYISPYYEANKEAIKIAFGYSNNPSRCSDDGTGSGSNSYFYCGVSGLHAYASANGYVSVDNTSISHCDVNNNGKAYCYW